MMLKIKRKNKSPTISKLPEPKKESPSVALQVLEGDTGTPDRISVGIGFELEISKWKLKGKDYVSYATDVGRYDADETVEQAKKRATEFVVDLVNNINNQLKNLGD